MTKEEFIELVKASRNRLELIQKLGGDTNTSENRRKYIGPLRKLAGISRSELTSLFKKE
jgi:hypothetical protein